MNLSKIRSVLGLFMLIGMVGFAQNDINCESIQCDCDNITGANANPETIALCKFYEKMMISKCKKGVTAQKCRPESSGPNAWIATIKDEKKVISREKHENDNLTNLFQDIRGAEDAIYKYKELHPRLLAFKNNTKGLSLAVELSDLTLNVHLSSLKINDALRFATYSSTYSEELIELFLPKLVLGMSSINDLEIDQIDLKYELAQIFNKMKRSGVDVEKMFEKGALYQNAKVIEFIKECYSTKSTNYSLNQMQDLRATSSRIYLRKLDALIPTEHSNKLTRPIKLVCKDVLDWNEHLIKDALTALELIANHIENKTWDQNEISQAYQNYNNTFNDDLWQQERYINSIKQIAQNLPIVWDLMKAIYLKK